MVQRLVARSVVAAAVLLSALHGNAAVDSRAMQPREVRVDPALGGMVSITGDPLEGHLHADRPEPRPSYYYRPAHPSDELRTFPQRIPAVPSDGHTPPTVDGAHG
ncbi:MAG: hypothetical protein HYV02_00315 [Deltaproteobacteria bacterium]|nr:hypothetical protein [Deltaproteobacteria bacterium]